MATRDWKIWDRGRNSISYKNKQNGNIIAYRQMADRVHYVSVIINDNPRKRQTFKTKTAAFKYIVLMKRNY